MGTWWQEGHIGMLVGIGLSLEEFLPKSPARPCSIFYAFRATSALDRFGGRLYGTSFFNMVLY